jgi:HlyD family secretion protein
MANDTRFRWSKWILILVVLGSAGSGGVWYFRGMHEAAIEYQTATVSRSNLVQAVTATGQLGPVVNVQVGSQISGIVQKLYVDWNSTVKSNQVIAEIDPSICQLGVLKAEADLANTKANLALTEVQARRADSLFTNGLISASDHDTALAQLQQAQAQVQSDEATLKNAQVQLSYCTIYAPVDGVVISRNVDVGQTVAASFNTPTLFMIANDLSKMQIDALVSEADIGGVEVGQNVNFSVDAFPYRTFRGKVSQIRYGAMTNQNVITYDCVIGVNNPDLKLLPSMTATAQIITAERQNVLKVPNAALRFHPPDASPFAALTNGALPAAGQGARAGGVEKGGGTGSSSSGSGGAGPAGGAKGADRPHPERQLIRTVYVLPPKSDSKQAEKAKPKPVQIKVGINDGISTEVVEGLEEGDEVVIGAILPVDAARPPGSPFGGNRRF